MNSPTLHRIRKLIVEVFACLGRSSDLLLYILVLNDFEFLYTMFCFEEYLKVACHNNVRCQVQVMN